MSQIISRYGLKCTYNINSGWYGKASNDWHLTRDEIKEHLLDKGHEIAVHGEFHKAPGIVRTADGIRDVLNCRLALEEKFDANEVESAPNGKFEIMMDGDKYYYVLKASNGVLLFTSKSYAGQKACLASIENFKQLLEYNNFKIYMDKNKIYVFKIYNKVNALIIVGEHYDSLAKCKNALTSVIRFGKEAKLVE